MVTTMYNNTYYQRFNTTIESSTEVNNTLTCCISIGGIFSYSRADMCLNCSLSVKSMKFGMMIVFKALKKIGYGAIAKKSVKCEK